MPRLTAPPKADGNRLMAFSGSTYDAETREADIVITTTAPVKRYGMIEVLSMADGAVDLSRVALGQVKLLDSHDSSSVEKVLGVLIDARIEGERLLGRVRFGETEEALEAAGQVARGEITGISCGYRVNEWMQTAYDADADIETWTGMRWELFEVSLVAIPADKFAGIRSTDSAFGPRAAPLLDSPAARLKKETGMPEATTTTVPEAPANPVAPAPAPDAAQIATAERQRAAQILELSARHNLPATFAPQHIEQGTSLDAVRAAALDLLEKSSPANAIKPGGASVTRETSPEELREAMADGFIMRLLGREPNGKTDPKIVNPERSREYAAMGILELGAELSGIRNAHRMPRTKLYEELIQRNMLGTSDFPLLLSAAANKFLLAQYQYQEPSYRQFSAKKNFNDFKAHNFLRVGDFPTLEKIAEGGEFRNGAISENREQVTAATYGKIVALTRQMFVNDDLSAFADLTGAAGRRVADFENSLAWGVILSNSAAGPTLSDTGALYNSTAVTTAGGHANLAGTAAGVTVAAIDAGRQSLRTKKSLDGIPLQLNPSIIVAGPQQQTAIEQLLSSALLATQLSNINPFNGGGMTSLTPVIDSYVTDKSWYLFSDPVAGPVFVWGYVTGFEGPRFAIDQPFRYDGLAFKVVEDFGFGAIDWRGTYRNAGA